MKKALILIGVAVLFILIFLNPSKEDSPPARVGPKLLSNQEQIALLKAAPAQPAVPKASSQGANQNLANMGKRPTLNPPHGQPFHSCDIPVGAPLDSSPEATARQTNTNQPVAAPSPTPSTPPANTGSKPTLNPPHGQPWHRCEIPVGAPLDSEPENTTRQTSNSSPITSTAQETINTNTQPVENAMPLNPLQTTSTTPENIGEKPALNPPHGQPWHRCDIRVGDTLP